MPDLKQILDEIKNVEENGTSVDIVRRKYIRELSEYRKRNVIVYYSNWLQNPNVPENAISDMDINGFMTTIHEMDTSMGLDLILHTPGGELAATENIVNYLRTIFSCDIDVFVPQLAMSAGTMIACSCRKIYMGKQSSLGPIDPQFYIPGVGQVAALGIIEEIERALNEIKVRPESQVFWANIFQKYNPTFIGKCEKAIEWSTQITAEWLKNCMFEKDPDAELKAKNVIDKIASHIETKSHRRHLSIQKCKEIGLKIEDLEQDQKLQDLVLSIHHSCMATFHNPTIIKIIENQKNKLFMTKIAIEKRF